MLLKNTTKHNLVYNDGLTLKPGVNSVTEKQVKTNKAYLDSHKKQGFVEEVKAKAKENPEAKK